MRSGEEGKEEEEEEERGSEDERNGRKGERKDRGGKGGQWQHIFATHQCHAFGRDAPLKLSTKLPTLQPK